MVTSILHVSKTKPTRTRSQNIRGEAIRMEARRFGFFPQTFVWRGRRYDVHSVERVWTVKGRWRHADCRYFRVCCVEGMVEVYQDVKRNIWHIEKLERGAA